VVTLVVLAVLGARVRSGLPAYYVLIAAGAPVVETWVAAHRPRLTRPLLVGLLVASGAVLVPLSTTLLEPSRIDALGRFLGGAILEDTSLVSPRLRRHSARCMDRYYERFADEVVSAWSGLPAGDRDGMGIFVPMLAEAAAVDHFGADHGLPPVLNGTESSRRRGLRDLTGDAMIVALPANTSLGDIFDHVEILTTLESRIGLCNNLDHQDIGIFLCRGWRIPRKGAWNILFLRAVGKENDVSARGSEAQ
jgi:hypothetical protein